MTRTHEQTISGAPNRYADEAIRLLETIPDIRILFTISTCQEAWMGSSWRQQCEIAGRRSRSS